jgi:hypothetical protein
MSAEVPDDPLARSRLALAASTAPGISPRLRALHLGVSRLCLEKAKTETARIELLVHAREEELTRTTTVEQLEIAIDGGAT